MKRREHKLTLGYTIDDDGVHLRCSCGEDILLGFGVDPWTAVDKAREHQLGMPVTTASFMAGLGGL